MEEHKKGALKENVAKKAADDTHPMAPEVLPHADERAHHKQKPIAAAKETGRTTGDKADQRKDQGQRKQTRNMRWKWSWEAS